MKIISESHTVAGCVALMVAQGAAVSSVAAQESSETVAPSLQEVVVSASRIQRSGFSEPTPVTVLNADDIARRGTTNISEALNQIPAFRPTQTSSVNTHQISAAGQQSADLRGLGPMRTLALLDGRRVVPGALTGVVNLNLIPTILLSRTEVVTGGASAAWGSDAVAGVVNLILDTRMQGFKSEVQYGQSERSDDEQFRAAFSGGSSIAGGRGHFVFGAEYSDEQGIGKPYERRWGRLEGAVVPNATPGVNGQPANIIGRHVHLATQAQGGLITSGPLRGTQFGPGGEPMPFEYGEAYGDYMFGGGGDGTNVWFDLKVPVERYSALANVDFDLTDNLRSFAQISYASSLAVSHNGYVRDAGVGQRALTIQRDNAYIPLAIQAQMDALNLSTLQMGRNNSDLGETRNENDSTAFRIATGLAGDLGPTWKWDAYYQFGRSTSDTRPLNYRRQSAWNRAIDAVFDPVTNQIVCRSTLSDPNDGCIPFNVFGSGSASEEAIRYVTADGWQDVTMRQHVVAANLRGDPFSTWAGPVSMATGVEYRREDAHADSDPVSRANDFNIGNLQPISAENSVKEIYLETVVPLASGQPWANSLEVNGAVRYTDYELSGGVTTWKAGLSYSPVPDVRLRATRSRDIRAPNMSELFSSPSQGRPSVRNPITNATQFTFALTGGNEGLDPEKGDTFTAGIVYQPSWLSGLRASVDYYRLELQDQIGSLGVQNIVDFCFAGAQSFCSLIEWDGTLIQRVHNTQLNLAEFETSGLDIEVSYDRPLFGGNLSLRVLATHVYELTSIVLGSNAQRIATDRAGQLGAGALNTPGGVPEWQVTSTATWAINDLSISVQARYIDSGLYDVGKIGPDDPNYSPFLPNSINDNTVPSYVYWNLFGHYDLRSSGAATWQIYAAINNLADKDPPFIPPPAFSTPTNPAFYDVVGRSYRMGLRVNF